MVTVYFFVSLCSFCLPTTNQKGSQSLGLRLPEVYTPLRGAARKERATSESRSIYTHLRGAPPSRLSVLCGVYAPFFGVLLGCVKWHKKAGSFQ